MRPPTNQFGADITNTEGTGNQLANMITTKLAGKAVIRVVSRCEDAKENNNLDLSECMLVQVPDAVYHLMRHTELKTCNLSSNVISKIPPKFAVKFSLITELNLSHNQMSRLPDELCELNELERLDLSHNTFVSLPNVVFNMPKLTHLNASNNHIIDVEVERINKSNHLEEVDLRDNPVKRSLIEPLQGVTRVRVLITPDHLHQWDDLDI